MLLGSRGAWAFLLGKFLTDDTLYERATSIAAQAEEITSNAREVVEQARKALSQFQSKEGPVAGLTTNLLQTMDAWTNGDFSGVLAGRYELLWAVAAGTVVAYLYADRFSIAGMGEGFAINLGVYLIKFRPEIPQGSALYEMLTYVSYLDLWWNTLDGVLAPRYLLFHISATVFFLYMTTKLLEVTA